ncbi:MAG: hypothetical protein ACOVSR_10245 [Bacteroidia bacterium]
MKKFKIKYVFNPSDKLSKIYSKVLNSVKNKQDNLIEIDIITGSFPMVNRNLKFTKSNNEVIKKYYIYLTSIHLQLQKSIY